MKIALAQLNYHTGNFALHQEQMVQQIQEARSEGADLVVFAELAVTGYPARDFLEFEHFLQLCDGVIASLAEVATDIGVIVGAPLRNTHGQGKPLFNAAYLLYQGKVQQTVSKTLLPTYDVFDEYRYFEPAFENALMEFKGVKLAVTICEDLWNVGHHARYVRNPLEEIQADKADILINIAASPFSKQQWEERLYVLGTQVARWKKPLLYVNHVGAQTELIFDGGSLALDAHGNKVLQMPFFKPDLAYVHYQGGQLTSEQPHHATTPDFNNELDAIHDALVLGIRDYFRKLGFKKAILGLSGGIDSALVTVLAARALGAENVHVLLMPSRYSSDHSVDDSLTLVTHLGISHSIISIENAFGAFEQTLSPSFEGTHPDITEENLQSRIRGMLLMAHTNKFGYILLNTSNKSELAVGYGTLYGDMCGGLSVIGDLYKTEVYALSSHINAQQEIIPNNILVKAPSAELRHNQTDQDSLPEYDLLDKLLFHYIEERKSPAELKSMGFEAAVVDKVMRLVNMNEYKRHQTPPILRISNKAFGMGRRMPIVARYLQ
ncbi:MAG: NAD+ synthase [Sphingobacteriaceae bacterium]|nr:NAD+ synthase [Sphingobacteriaceae bacterium]